MKKWMNENRLMLNDNKTEVLLTGSAGSLSKLERSSTHIGDSDIKFSNKIKNLGIHFDSDIARSSHVNALIRTMYCELRKIGKICHLINTDCATLLVSSLVLSKLDYCNSLLAVLPSKKLKKLQTVQNNAARLVFKKSKRDSPIPLLETLHWLPVEKRISCKLATMCHKCIYGNAPSYLTNILQLYTPSRHLRSSLDSKILVTPRLKLKTIGDRSFSFCGPKTWNSLPKDLRETASFDTFKRQLKIFLFKSWKPWRHSWGILVLVVIHLMHHNVTLSFKFISLSFSWSYILRL